ncbi:MAG: ABC transporter ATP-binding protein [Actinomycetota bacterium]|nr:ABC transporter ATP-binding protein [Actinomycetota bacterium]
MKESTGLRVVDLVIGYDSPLHEPFTFSVAPGDVLAVVGPSGCGKSTLLGTIAGLTPALGGSIEIGGRDITALPINERRVAMVFQEALLFPHLNVRDNVAYGPRRAGVSREEARAEADRLLTWVDLEGYGDRSIEQLSGGQAQRVSLARALAAKPDALCLDEPFSALDAPLRSRLAQDVLAIVARAGIPAIHVTHDPDEAAAMAHGNPGGSILSM